MSESYPVVLKRCTVCGIDKPVPDAYFMRSGKNGPRPFSDCKLCTKDRSNARYAAQGYQPTAALRALHNAWRRANRARVRDAERLRDPFKDTRNGALARTRQYGVAYESIDYQAIVDESGMICYLCKNPVTAATLTFDHVFPMSRGGQHSASNLRVAHRACNSSKGNRILGPAE